MQDRCPPLDRALSSLLADLDARGMLEETLVVLATEFGRTPRIVTERMGRNHYPKAFTCLPGLWHGCTARVRQEDLQ